MLALLGSVSAWAHLMRPDIVTVTLKSDGTYDLIAAVNAEALIAEIGPGNKDTSESPNAAVYDALRALPPEALRARIAEYAPKWIAGLDLSFDGQRSNPEFLGAEVPAVGDIQRLRISTFRLRGKIPPGAKQLVWHYREDFGDSVVRVGVKGREAIQSEYLRPGQASKPIPLGIQLASKSRSEVALEYTGLGFTHILPKGLDHILFVLGIFLLSTRLKPLLFQVTAFTIAHSITLALSMYGIISLPSTIVEPLISLSIVYVAVENVLTAKLHSWRVVIVFLFGLLHGLGFAGVLIQLGLPRNEFVTALITFNIGVEFGQLAVISTGWFAAGKWFGKKPWYRQRVVIPCSLLIAAIGMWWTVERVMLI